MQSILPKLKPKTQLIDFKSFLQIYREPVVTYQIIPNNSPEKLYMNDHFGYGRSKRVAQRNLRGIANFDEDVYSNPTSDMILNTISGLFSKFYAPERIRFYRDGIKIKMNDVVSYKVTITNGEMRFYLTVPKKWAKGFISAIKKDWGQVDIAQVNEEIISFNPNKAKAMEVHMRHHYALSMKYGRQQDDTLYSSIASLASTLDENDKILIDYNIEPVDDSWKDKAQMKIKQFKNGGVPAREDMFTIGGIIGRAIDMLNVIFDEFVKMIEELMGVANIEGEDKEELFELQYSDKKLHANSKGYKMQIRILGESNDDKKVKYAFRNIENAFSTLDGDNKFVVTHIKTKRGIKSIIKAVENNAPILNKTKDIYFEKEMENILRLPSKQTLEEYKKNIIQDSFTRTEIDSDFLNGDNGAIPFAKTLDKESKRIYFGGYEREWWTYKGRYVKDKTKLDDRSTATMVIGRQGSGKTSLSETQALYTFGAHLSKEEWKEKSKSVVVFDVADGEMIKNIYNHVPDWLKDRVVILNHGNFNYPIAVNNADLEEFNREVMKDDDYAYTLAEMEARLMLEILESDKSISIDRWFTSALQAVHSIDKDWGYIEAMKALIDDEFRATEIIPNLSNNRRLRLEMETFHNMSVNGNISKIIQTIENRFSQLERDQKLWDCIAQRPLRDENGKVKLNFRKLMDGDENGAYLILIHIPKSGVSNLYRKFIFAHYFTKIWNVALSREYGFAGREYRPETLIIIDEIHQILNIPLVAKLFIDLFKEPRKYSLRLWLTLHGFSSFSTAGKSYESAIKQSILDNGCNLIMLKGGSDSFDKLEEFLAPYTIADYNNLMNIPFTGIFSIHWKSKMHVFQAKLIEHVSKNKDFKKYRELNSDFLTKFKSEYGVDKNVVREDNLNRAYSMIEKALESDIFSLSNDDLERLKSIGKKKE